MPSFVDEVAARIGRRSSQDIEPLGHRHRVRRRLAAAEHVQRDHVADEAAIQAHLQLAAVLHRLAVERQHDVANGQAGDRRRAARQHVGQDHPGGPLEAEAGRQLRR